MISVALCCRQNAGLEHIYLNSLIFAAGQLPGNIVGALLIDRVQRRFLMCASMLGSAGTHYVNEATHPILCVHGRRLCGYVCVRAFVSCAPSFPSLPTLSLCVALRSGPQLGHGPHCHFGLCLQRRLHSVLECFGLLGCGALSHQPEKHGSRGAGGSREGGVHRGAVCEWLVGCGPSVYVAGRDGCNHGGGGTRVGEIAKETNGMRRG